MPVSFICTLRISLTDSLAILNKPRVFTVLRAVLSPRIPIDLIIPSGVIWSDTDSELIFAVPLIKSSRLDSGITAIG